MEKKTIRVLLLCATALLFTQMVSASDPDSGSTDVYFFYSSDCPHCQAEKPLLEYIDQNNDNVEVYFYEVHEHEDKFEKFRKKYGVKSGSVPQTFIKEKNFFGYSKGSGSLEYVESYNGYIGYRNQIIRAIEKEAGAVETPSGTGMPFNPAYLYLIVFFYTLTYPLFRTKIRTTQRRRLWTAGLLASFIIVTFLFISFTPPTVINNFVDALPFPLFVVTLALADGFNPCAFTVFIILLSLLTYTRRRNTMLIIGTTFILTSALMYFVFIMLMIFIGRVFLENYGFVFIVFLGVVILIAGLINVKDYFFNTSGLTLSLSEENKSRISKRAGRLARGLAEGKRNTKKLVSALAGTFFLAAFVNLIELGCTAILPSVYMATLISTYQSTVPYITWTIVYALVYIIPLFALLLNFMLTFTSSRLTESHGRHLKLIGGVLMVLFGLLMVFEPTALSFG